MRFFILVTIGLFLGLPVIKAQELEPRALTNIPLGTNFIVVGYGYSQGNLLLDPSVPIEDLDSKINAPILAYARSISLFGKSAKVDAVLPLANGIYEGYLNGEYRSRELSGFGDPRIRVSINFAGAPALSMGEFKEYRPKNIWGASLQVVLPFGQYDPSKLINLGSNRVSFKPQVGFATRKNRWIFETYFSTWLFAINSDFYGGIEKKQKPLFGLKQHAIYSFKNRMWMTFDAGYGFGGQSIFNGVDSDTRISTFRFGSTFATPIKKNHTIRLTLNTGIRLERGPNFNSIMVTYQYRWFKNS